MSIFKEAARLAGDWVYDKEGRSKTTIAGDQMAKLLRTIAAMDVEVEPVAARFKSKGDDLNDWQHVPATATLPLGQHALYVIEPPYTQQSLDAAVLKAKDGSLKKELLTLVLDDNIRGEYTTDSGGMSGESIQCASCGVSEYTACMEGELEHKSDCKWIKKIAAKNKLRAILAGSKQ